jgi:uncharacterized protein YbaR (Trm112 family)/SAM-dependent methyltransferase
MDSTVLKGIICPSCRSRSLNFHETEISCKECGKKYPLVHDVPVLINDGQSIFSISSIIKDSGGFFDHSRKGKILEKFSRALPALQTNLHTKKNYAFLKQQLLHLHEPRILVVGAGNEGRGIKSFLVTERFKFVMSDVCFGPSINAVFDAHSIPYEDGAFDCIISQAVLEHVLDPGQCVGEFYRVLKPQGYVYSETPFMQQVHGGSYDFTRFTKSGHRWLFRNFSEIASGLTAGPASALAWSMQYFILSFARSRSISLGIKLLFRCLFFWIKYFDYLLKNSPAAMDGACSFFFIGRKTEAGILPEEMLSYYRMQAEKHDKK